VIYGLLSNKVNDKEILMDYVAVKVQEVFIPTMMVPNVDETPGLVKPHHVRVKISFRATIPWSSKFLKLAQDARSNHVVVL
jgi:hypothetical protein